MQCAYKKLSYRVRTARRAMSVGILSVTYCTAVAISCTTDPKQIEVIELYRVTVGRRV